MAAHRMYMMSKVNMHSDGDSLSVPTSEDVHDTSDDYFISRPRRLGSVSGIDELLEARIDRINTRLKKTDGNIKSMQSLLSKRGNIEDHRNRQSNLQESCSHREPVSASNLTPHNIVRGSADGLVDLRFNRAKSVDCLDAPVASPKSPTVEHLQRLTQSVQDLRDVQQRFHDDLRVEVLCASRIDNIEAIKDVFETLIHGMEKSSVFGIILDKLIELQQDLKAEQGSENGNCQLIAVIEDLNQQVQYLKYGVVPSLRSAHGHDNQNDIESNGKCSRVVNADGEDSCVAAKANKVIKKLKARNNLLIDDQKRVKDSFSEMKERCRALLVERGVLTFQVEDLQARLRVMTEEQDCVKKRIANDSEERFREEKIRQKLQLMLENTEKDLYCIKDELEKSKHENSNLTRFVDTLREENSTLTLKLERCLVEAKLQSELKESLKVSNNAGTENVSELQLADVKSRLQVLIDQGSQHSMELKDFVMDLRAIKQNDIGNNLNSTDTGLLAVLELLKKQLSDAQGQIAAQQSENGNHVVDKSKLHEEASRLRSENCLLRAKYEKLVKVFHFKSEDGQMRKLRVKELQTKLRDLSRVACKMEREYKYMLRSINCEIDKMVRLWNLKSPSDSANVLSETSVAMQHPKVLFIDIQGKLHCMMDNLHLVSGGLRLSKLVESGWTQSEDDGVAVVSHNLKNEGLRAFQRNSSVESNRAESGGRQPVVIPNSIANQIKLNLAEEVVTDAVDHSLQRLELKGHKQVNSTAIALKSVWNDKDALADVFTIAEPSCIENVGCGNLSCLSSITEPSDMTQVEDEVSLL